LFNVQAFHWLGTNGRPFLFRTTTRLLSTSAGKPTNRLPIIAPTTWRVTGCVNSQKEMTMTTDASQPACPAAPQPSGPPPKQGLYDPAFEKDACGVGFVVNIKGVRSHTIVRQAMTVLVNLNHRGACGCEPNTGDGAGINMQMPDKFFRRVAAECGCALPALGEYGVGMVFLPKDADARRTFEAEFEQIVAEEGQTVLGWRDVPTDNSTLGATAIAGEPFVRQIFIGCNADALYGSDALAFERKLYVIRKRAEKAIRYNGYEHGKSFYIASLSSRTVVYKGMLLADQVDAYYPDLLDPDMEAAIAVVHSRFSTNTFPSWDRAHPYRYLIHNGEINTIRGNVNWMYARQSVLQSELFGPDLEKFKQQIVDPDGSDSAQFDNALEFLHLAGRPLHHVAMMMIPEPWSNHESMAPELRAFYEYHATLMEPWDGPASIAFTDGTVVGAVLDRNGLRPSRYYVTKDDIVVMASEVGVLDDQIPPENVAHKSRLQPGRMFLVDTAQGRIIADEEIKQTMAAAYPYQEWLDKNLVELDNLPSPPDLYQADQHGSVLHRQHIFGYTFETQRTLLAPMAKNGVEALGSMGDDTPIALLSDRPQLLYTYFRQLFAQVTNPPLDAIREELVTATDVMLGTEGNVLETAPENCHQIRLKNPILTNEQLAKLARVKEPGFKAQNLPMLFPVRSGPEGLEKALDYLFMLADEAIEQGVNIFILSDRGVSREMAPIPALLATAGLHHHLIRRETRTQCALVVESGEPREVHHFALLIGYGATAVNPYMAYETIYDLIDQGLVTDIVYEKAKANYIKASMKGVGTVAAGVAKGHADVILISGHDGGTGASPQSSIKHAGLPWELGVAETHQTLVLNDLRSRIYVEVDGQLKTGRDVIVGALLGAEEFGFATAPLVAMGCVMMRVCHLNTCPVGVATQDPRLRKKFTGDAEQVVTFMRFIAQEVRELMAQLGFRTINEMVGRSDKLEMRQAIDFYKAKGLDFSKIFHRPDMPESVGRYRQIEQDHGLQNSLDMTTLLELCKPALERGEKVEASLPIRNIHRVVGTITGSEVTRRHGAKGLPEDTIKLNFTGSAGQSFGAFMPKGMTLTLEGDANDYVGKGLSGGKIVVFPPAGSTFVPEDNVIIGNVALYGATAGEVFIRGMAGERFAVRNSGVDAVVESVGDHGCEYMTGGRVVILGQTGRNFAAGMSGGTAYILDETDDFPRHCNMEMVKLYRLDDKEEAEWVRGMIRKHAEYTRSDRAWKILALWEQMRPHFVKVYPNDYKRVIETLKKVKATGVSDDEAEMMAFDMNAKDLARAGGK